MAAVLDEDDDREQLVHQEHGAALVRGRAAVRDVNRALDLELPEDDRWSTIAGLCMHRAGCVPQKGAKVQVEGIADLEVVEASPREVRWIRVVPILFPPEPEPA